MSQLTPIQMRGRAIIERLKGLSSEPKVDLADVSGPRIGVVLGGGSARGLTHIPYIEAMDELGLKPSVIAGCSIGALIGAGWAGGLSGREIREHALEVLGTLRLIAGRLWTTQFRGLGGLIQNGLNVQLDPLKVVESFVPERFALEFKDLAIPLYVVATDFQSWDQVVFSEGPLKPAVAASIAIPGLFKPMPYAHRVLVDGGVVNPLPLDQAAPDSDILIAVDVNGDPSEALNKTAHKISEVWFGSAQIMMHALIAHNLAAYPPDIFIRPHLPSLGALEFWRVREIMEHADKEKDRFKRALSEKVDAFIANGKRMP